MNLAGEGMLTGGKTGMRLSMKEKRRQAAALQSGPPRKAALLEIAGDQEFQGAGDDFEFDGEAGKGLAVDLGVEGILVERLADHGVGLVEMHARGADNAEMRETVAKDFAGALPPVGQHAKTRFQVEVEGIDDHAVGTGAADAEKILFLFGLFEGSRQSERDFFYGAANELIGRAGNIPGQIQFFGENVRGSAGK